MHNCLLNDLSFGLAVHPVARVPLGGFELYSRFRDPATLASPILARGWADRSVAWHPSQRRLARSAHHLCSRLNCNFAQRRWGTISARCKNPCYNLPGTCEIGFAALKWVLIRTIITLYSFKLSAAVKIYVRYDTEVLRERYRCLPEWLKLLVCSVRIVHGMYKVI